MHTDFETHMRKEGFEILLPIQIHTDQTQPIYHQIKEQIRELILSGQLVPGTPLPSIRTLAQDLSCSVITTRRAYQELEHEGFIVTKQGLGTFVAEGNLENTHEYKQKKIEEVLKQLFELANRLSYPKQELNTLFQKYLDDYPDMENTGLR